MKILRTRMFSFAIKGASSLKKKKTQTHRMENHRLCAANTNNDELQQGKHPRAAFICAHTLRSMKATQMGSLCNRIMQAFACMHFLICGSE